MADYKSLPLYEPLFKLLRTTEEVVSRMNKDYKTTLGSDLRKLAIFTITLMYRANSQRDKVPHIKELLERLQQLIVLYRICVDLKLLSTGQFSIILELEVKADKQARSWLKHEKSQRETLTD